MYSPSGSACGSLRDRRQRGHQGPDVGGAAIEALPHRPERIVVVDTKDLPLNNQPLLRGLDAFVLCGSSVIYLRRQSATLLAANTRRTVRAHARRHHLA